MLVGLMGPLFIAQLFNIDMDGTARRAAISSNQEEQKTMGKSDLIVRGKGKLLRINGKKSSKNP